jgi:GR25 family glycosyltransferase involved in LPS biosynthesis
MLILEDDVVFTCKKGKSRFAGAFAKAWKMLPSDYSILYLGFSSRGERRYVKEETRDGASIQEQKHQSSGYLKSNSSSTRPKKDPLDPEILLYRPTYGFHTHAYVINKTGAAKLLDNLPVVGPIDVWLADNEWFGLSGVYCAVIAHEGWRSDDGTYEGTNLISQDRKTHPSDIQQSSLQKAS